MNPAVAPILLLGSPGAGLERVAALLAAGADVSFGDTLPAAGPDVPATLLSTAAATGHNRLLAALDRDWTCPPAAVDPDDPAAAALHAGIDVLAGLPAPWAVADPRTLCTLSVWAQRLPAVRPLAVVADHAVVVGTLVAEHGLPAYAADDVARAYARRLRELVERLDLPVVATSQPADGLVERVGAVAGALGLAWDAAAARAALHDGPVASRIGLDDEEAAARLLARAAAPPTDPFVTGEALTAAVRAAGATGEHLGRHLGPRAAARRQAVWDAAARHPGPALEVCTVTATAGAVDPVRTGGVATAVDDVEGLHGALLSRTRRPAAVVAPDLVAWVATDQLGSVLGLLHHAVQLPGVVTIGVSTSDQAARSRRGWAPLSAAAVAAAARDASFVVSAAAVDDHLTVLRLLPVPTVATAVRGAADDEPLTVTVGPADVARVVVRRVLRRLRRSRVGAPLAAVAARVRRVVRSRGGPRGGDR